MYQGNWHCSSCGEAITELPFAPRSEKGLTCRVCYAKGKAEGETPLASAAAGGSIASEELPTAPPFDPTAPPETSLAPQPPEFADAPATTERQTFTGEWSCSICGGAITSLPFAPRSTTNLKCLDCFKQSKT